MKKQFSGSFLLLILFFGLLHSCGNIAQKINSAVDYATAGPDSGSLVIVGGGMKDSAIINRFISLAGGVDAPLIVIPTASGENVIDNTKAAEILTFAGARNVTVLHTYDSSVANSDAFVLPLKNARGVWFGGGRQWRLVDAYANTLTEKEIRNVLARGGVIGGSSAGATIQEAIL